jgi:hypothetical protein
MKFGYSKVLVFLGIVLSSATTFAQPVFRGESVEYDHAGKRWFTSDNGTSIIQRDSNHVVSYFGSGLKASYGMEIVGNTLFACEGTKIYGYDLTTATQVMMVNVTGSAFLNGLTSNGSDKLYTTCFTNKKIFEIDITNLASPIDTEIVAATVKTPNGIVYDSTHNRLIFVCWGSAAPIKAVDLTTFAMTTLVTTNLTNIDGIDDDGLGHYYVSSWSPTRISRFDTNFIAAPVTISAPGINNPADICYAQGIDTLGIPNGNGAATFIGFGPAVGIAPVAESALRMTVAPNPLTLESHCEFFVQEEGTVQLEMINVLGSEAAMLIDETLAVGRHVAVLPFDALPRGVYLLRLSSGGQRQVLRVVRP